MNRKSMQITFNLDLNELDNVSGSLAKHSNKLNIQKSAVTEMIMERKLSKVLNNNKLQDTGLSNCFCSSSEFFELYKLYEKVWEENKVLTDENKMLKTENVDAKSK